MVDHSATLAAVFLRLERLAIFPPLAKGVHHFSPLAKGGTPFFPPLRRGGWGGGSGTTSHKVFPRFSLPVLSHPSREASRIVLGFQGSRITPPAPSQGGGKGLLARDVIPSRATEPRVSKSSLQLSQHRLFTGPASRPCAGFLQTRAVRLDPRTASVQNARVDVPDRLARGPLSLSR
jgi:hypothetical protein